MRCCMHCSIRAWLFDLSSECFIAVVSVETVGSKQLEAGLAAYTTVFGRMQLSAV